jgi:hypothetical protein
MDEENIGSSTLQKRRHITLLDLQFGYFRLPCGYSRRTQHYRSRARALHSMCELTHSMAWARHAMCESAFTGPTDRAVLTIPKRCHFDNIRTYRHHNAHVQYQGISTTITSAKTSLPLSLRSVESPRPSDVDI